MNRFEQPRVPTEARIQYLDGDYQVKAPGNFVKCAITGKTIMLEELKYWSVSRQEAYIDADAALKAYESNDLQA